MRNWISQVIYRYHQTYCGKPMWTIGEQLTMIRYDLMLAIGMDL